LLSPFALQLLPIWGNIYDAFVEVRQEMDGLREGRRASKQINTNTVELVHFPLMEST